MILTRNPQELEGVDVWLKGSLSLAAAESPNGLPESPHTSLQPPTEFLLCLPPWVTLLSTYKGEQA